MQVEKMRENLTRRAWTVVCKSLLEAHRRGHDSIEATDLVVGIIAEDQDPRSLELNEQHPAVKHAREMKPPPKGVLFGPESWIPREPFLPAELAAGIPWELKDVAAKPGNIPRTGGLPMSAEFERIFEVAEQLRSELRHGKIEPLHILAAALRESSSRILKDVGITEDTVMEALKRTGAADSAAT